MVNIYFFLEFFLFSRKFVFLYFCMRFVFFHSSHQGFIQAQNYLWMDFRTQSYIQFLNLRINRKNTKFLNSSIGWSDVHLISFKSSKWQSSALHVLVSSKFMLFTSEGARQKGGSYEIVFASISVVQYVSRSVKSFYQIWLIGFFWNFYMTLEDLKAQKLTDPNFSEKFSFWGKTQKFF